MDKKLVSFVICLLYLFHPSAEGECNPSLSESIETPVFDYRIRYTTDTEFTYYFTETQAQVAADTFDPAHQQFVDLGFLDPFFLDDRYVCKWDYYTAVNPRRIYLNAENNNDATEPNLRVKLNHELFHNLQYAYMDDLTEFSDETPLAYSSWTKEGTARLMQDKVWADLDEDEPTEGRYLDTVNSYRANPSEGIPVRSKNRIVPVTVAVDASDE